MFEHGAKIVYRKKAGYTPDADWDAIVQKTVATVLRPWEYTLHQAGLQTVWEGRTTSFKVYESDPNSISPEEAEQIKGEFAHPEVILTQNKNKLYALPTIATKDKAIQYLLEKYGIHQQYSFGLGDDDNDIGLLSFVGIPHTIASAKEHIKQLVSAKKGYISPYGFRRGGVDALEHILQLISN